MVYLKKTTQIKTIWIRLENRDQFDKEVNEALQDGWDLDRTEVYPAKVSGYSSMIFALLTKHENKEE